MVWAGLPLQGPVIGCYKGGRSHSQECRCDSKTLQLWGPEWSTTAESLPTHTHIYKHTWRQSWHTNTHWWCHMSCLTQTLSHPHLKHFFIQESGAEHSHSICADLRILSSGEVKGRHFLTVQKERDLLTFHTIRQSVPPVRWQSLLLYLCDVI